VPGHRDIAPGGWGGGRALTGGRWGRLKLGIFCALDHHPDLGATPRDDYRRAIDEACHAERLGLESFWVTEHHFASYGIAPEPSVLLAAVAERTRHLRLGSAMAILPFDHPLRTAERYALLDQLSGGRLEFGVGSGYLQHEFAGFGIDPARRRERFDDALAVIRRAWAGGPVRHVGRCFQIEAPALSVLPLQPGGPPIHVGVTSPAAAPFVGRQGFGLATVPYIALHTCEELAREIAAYRQALPPGTKGGVTAVFHCFCGDCDDDLDYGEAERALERYLRTRVVPGARYGGGPVSRDFVLFGGMGELAMRLAALAAMGVDRALLLTTFGGISRAATAASMERIGHLVPAAARLGPG